MASSKHLGTRNLHIGIHGIGMTGGFGCGLDALHQSLAHGAIRNRSIFFDSGSTTVEIPAYLATTEPLSRYLHNSALRRIDTFSRMGILASFQALEDAGELEYSKDRLGIVVASGYGPSRTTFAFLDSVINGGDQFASPTTFSNSVHNAAAAHISILLRSSGPTMSVSQFGLSFAMALSTAIGWLEEDRADAVLVGGIDEYCPVLGYSWHRFFGDSAGPLILPFRFREQSAILGEGAVFFLLRKGRGQAPYGTLQEIRTGKERPDMLSGLADAVFILSADGHRKCGARYLERIPPETEVSAYSPLYGSLPVGQAFDLAVAGLGLRGGKIFASPVTESDQKRLRVICSDTPLEKRRICSLKLDIQGGFAVIVMEH
jgi:3-oxoacyl-[acyl-carrier-protein] synthase II